ncbi:hypothetical protein GLOTRDRAFT_110989, partial [Gloeophyllum trabeum ATCC 11539]
MRWPTEQTDLPVKSRGRPNEPILWTVLDSYRIHIQSTLPGSIGAHYARASEYLRRFGAS